MSKSAPKSHTLGWDGRYLSRIGKYRYMIALNYCSKPLPPDEYELQSHKDSQASGKHSFVTSHRIQTLLLQ